MAKSARLDILVNEVVNELLKSKAGSITPEIITRILIDKGKLSELSFNSKVFEQVKIILKEMI